MNVNPEHIILINIIKYGLIVITDERLLSLTFFTYILDFTLVFSCLYLNIGCATKVTFIFHYINQRP